MFWMITTAKTDEDRKVEHYAASDGESAADSRLMIANLGLLRRAAS
jgi:hypothetical protein